MRPTLASLFALILTSNFLFAQSESAPFSRFYYHISVQAANPAESFSKSIKGEEAAKFDVSSFLAQQKEEDRVKISGEKTNNTDRISFTYDSKNLKRNGDCSDFCEKVESLVRVPFLGVAITPMDDFSGVRIDHLFDNSPLNEKGIEAGAIITSVDVHEIADPCNLISAVSKQEVDQLVDINYLQNGKSLFTTVKLAYRVKKTITWVNCCQLTSNTALPLETSKMTLNVFPNPTVGFTQFEFSSSSLAETQVRLSDFSGRVIKEKTILPLNGAWSDYLDLSSFGAGVYILQLEQEQEVLTERIVVVQE